MKYALTKALIFDPLIIIYFSMRALLDVHKQLVTATILYCVSCFALGNNIASVSSLNVVPVTDESLLCIDSVFIGNDTTICFGTNLVLDAGPGHLTYLWQDGSTFQTFTATTPGYYSVTVTEIDTCVYTDSIYIQVIMPPQVNLGTDTTVCAKPGLLLDAGAGFLTYLWQNGTSGSTFTATTAGTYSITVTNSCGSDVDSITIATYPNPNVILGVDVVICNGFSHTLMPWNTYDSYLWQDGSTDSVFTASISGDYSVTVSNQYGCTDVDSVTVTVIDGAVVNLGPDLSICDNPLPVNLDAGSGFNSYRWSDGSLTQTNIAQTSKIYCVTVTSSCGESYDCVELFECEDCPVDVPKAFSPNGDGINDILYIRGSDLASVNLVIFDRHGQQVFEANDIATGWDGTFNGVSQNIEVYGFDLNAVCRNGKKIHKKGNISLVR